MNNKTAKILKKYRKLIDPDRQMLGDLKPMWNNMSHKEKGKFRKGMKEVLKKGLNG